jgi:uncharacterized protein (TIGR04141 family)
MAKPPKQRLTWFLLKPAITCGDVEDIVDERESGSIRGYRIAALNPDVDSLFVRASHPRPPKWLGYVRAHLTDELPKILGAASSGLLLVESGGAVLAATFGYGRFLLKPDALVQDFGLKVVLNSVDPSQLKSVDARSFDELTVHTRRGVSRDSSLTAFGLDVTRDLLRGVTGRSSDPQIPGSLTGSAALALNTAVQVPDLPDLAGVLAKAYRAKRYRSKNFAFIDHMRAERDPTTLQQLDNELLRALEAKELTEMHLAIPDAIDWQGVAGVRFSFKRKHHEPTPDPKISVYRALREDELLTVQRLKTDKVEAVSAVDEGQLSGHWRVYDCIVFETELNGYLYVLSGGDWFRISKSYRDRVEEFVRSIPELAIDLPFANANDDERAYNIAAAEAIGALSVDAKLVALGGPDRVELCDILTVDGLFIHVKKRGRSSTLSHLFAQGVTSVELLLNDEQFLKDASEVVASLDPKFATAIPTVSGARDEIRVAYVIISRGQRPEKPFGLPFFSLVSLQAAAQRFKNAGVALSVKEVKEQPASVT